jgi:hypothetical protein
LKIIQNYSNVGKHYFTKHQAMLRKIMQNYSNVGKVIFYKASSKGGKEEVRKDPSPS